MDLKTICDVEHELGLKTEPEQYDVYLSCLLFMNYGLKIEYGILRYTYGGKTYERGYTWSESKEGRIIDLNMFIKTDLMDEKKNPVILVKRPIINGVFEFNDIKDTMKPAEKNKVCYVYIDGAIQYFKDPEAINYALVRNRVKASDFDDVLSLEKKDGDGSQETISKNKAKEYVRVHGQMFAAAIKKYSKLKLKFI